MHYNQEREGRGKKNLSCVFWTGWHCASLPETRALNNEAGYAQYVATTKATGPAAIASARTTALPGGTMPTVKYKTTYIYSVISGPRRRTTLHLFTRQLVSFGNRSAFPVTVRKKIYNTTISKAILTSPKKKKPLYLPGAFNLMPHCKLLVI